MEDLPPKYEDVVDTSPPPPYPGTPLEFRPPSFPHRPHPRNRPAAINSRIPPAPPQERDAQPNYSTQPVESFIPIHASSTRDEPQVIETSQLCPIPTSIAANPTPPILHPASIPSAFSSDDESMFDDNSSRLLFATKVFGILFFQLQIIMKIICIFLFKPTLKKWTRVHKEIIVIPACCAWGAVQLSSLDCAKLRAPQNFILLAVTPVTLGVLLGTVSAFIDSLTLLLVVGATSVGCGAIAFVSLFRIFDFTICTGSTTAIISSLLVYVVALFLLKPSPSYLYCCIATVVLSICLVRSVVHMMKSDYKYHLHPRGCIFGAHSVYTAIFIEFFLLLCIVSHRSSNENRRDLQCRCGVVCLAISIMAAVAFYMYLYLRHVL